MQNLDRNALRDRAFEEIHRVLAHRRPRLTYRDISQAIGRNAKFLTSFKLRPDRYILSIEDLHKLHYLYGVDDVYILKGIRYPNPQLQLVDTSTLPTSI